MHKTYNCIIHYMDAENFVLYSYITGKFYLVNVNTLCYSLAEKFRCLNGKSSLYEEELFEIIKNAQNPQYVDYAKFRYPLVVGIMVTNRCNLKCNYCIANNGRSYSEKDNFSQISTSVLSELVKSSVISVMISGGEPTLYSGLNHFLVELSQGKYLCLLDTNGTLIGDGLTAILKTTGVIPRVSLDSIHSAEHNANRGKFEATLQNIEKMCTLGIDLRINTVLSKTNVHSLGDLAGWLCSRGINKWHIFKLQQTFAPTNIWLGDDEAMSTLSQLEQIYGRNIDILFKFSKRNDGFSSFVIDSEGLCFSTQNMGNGCNKKRIFGSILNKSLNEIWRSTPLDYRLRHYNKYLTYISKEI